MSDAFRSSDDFDEHAHQLYNDGRYDEAIAVLKEGLTLYADAVELHVGMAYARLAREDYAWARRAFEHALLLDPDHEDALAGMGENLLKIGERKRALQCFEQTLSLGLQDDYELMLQIGRALFRENLLAQAHRFFDLAATAQPDSPDAAACLGYTSHRLGRESEAFYWIRRALELEPQYAEARIYLANALYDRGETDAALHQVEKTLPEDHFDELAIWRLIELKKAVYRLPDDDPELQPWYGRLAEIGGEPDRVEELLAEIEALQADGGIRDPNQLELFGTLLSELQAMQRRPGAPTDGHIVTTLSGHTLRGTWDEILAQFKADAPEWAHATMTEFMLSQAQLSRAETGIVVPVTNAESFIRGSAEAGVLRIIQ